MSRRISRPDHWMTRRELLAWLSETGRGTYEATMTHVFENEDPPMPVAEHGGGKGRPSFYDPDAVAEWFDDRSRRIVPGGEIVPPTESVSAANPMPGINDPDPRVRKLAWEAEIARLKALEASGALIPGVDLERALAGNVLAVRTALTDLPALLAARTRDAPPEQHEALARVECDAILARLATGEGNPEIQLAEEADHEA